MMIGITGKAGSGKDELGSMILREITQSYKYSLADPIKLGLRESFGYTREHLYGSKKENIDPELGFSPRAALQEFGMCMRNLNPDIWLNLAQRKQKSTDWTMIVCDIRFENEAKWMRDNGILIHIQRDNVESVRDHQSENGIRYVTGDVKFDNNGTLKEMFVFAEKMSQL